MKIIITGATGFIGSQVLSQCLQDPRITKVYTLTRRPLPPSVASDPKLVSIVQQDFLTYSDEVLKQLAGAEACIWTLGQTKFTINPRLVDVAYSQAAAQAFTTHLQPLLPSSQPFRFIHTSGILAEQDQTRSLWFLDEPRKSKGQSEVELLRFADAHDRRFEAYVARAGGVLAEGNRLAPVLEFLAPGWVIEVGHLALGMMSLLWDGGRGGIVENPELIRRGQRAVHG